VRRFSERLGITPPKTNIQIKSIDDELRNGLWNALDLHYWRTFHNDNFNPGQLYQDMGNDALLLLITHLWLDYFKLPLDTLGHNWQEIYSRLRKHFFDSEWFTTYNFIEFIAANYPNSQVNAKFMEFCNLLLERELSAYRFVGGVITPITSDTEISEINEAMRVPMTPVHEHLQQALKYLSDRKSPDYRNSIKESISAVEALSRVVVKDKKATLGEALKAMKPIHPVLQLAFEKLYGYTSDEGGIRHALVDDPTVSFEKAKFMLVSCSAFTNYLVGKAGKAGIKLK